ncbi:MAG: PAS domain S-box protein [Halobacteriota archaeon]
MDKEERPGADKFARLRSEAEEVLSEPATDLEELSREDIRKLIHELRIHQYELEVQNEELRSTQEELEQSRNSYFELFDLAPIGYFTVDKKDQILNLNLTASELLEKDRNEVEQMGFSHFIYPDDLGLYYSHRRKVFDTGARQTCELRMKKGGDVFHARLDIGLIHNYENAENYLLVTVSDITELKERERELMQLYTAVENASDSIIITDDEGYISYTNEATLELFHNPKDKNFVELLDPKDRKKAEFAISQLKENKSIVDEFYISKEDNRAIESKMNIMRDNGNIIGFLIVSRDISERKKAEQDLKKKLMRFKLEEGDLYLEENFDKSVNALRELVNAGYDGLIVSRTPKEDLNPKKGFDFDFDFWWITERGDGVASLSELENKFYSLPQKKAVLIDRLDYFISKYGFKEVINFAHNLRDITYLKDLIVILVLDPSTLDKKSFALLSKETSEIEPRDIDKMPEDLLSILKFVYSQNKIGVKPSFTDICDHLNVSKPTVRKKVKTLVNRDYLTESVEGTYKRVEITDKTRNLFWK